ncbi:MAG: hypothetical protein GX758_04815, partial [Tenericutes bacterium]|nr:hypothetical protein [Mycoplasmatota bacterium]
MKVKLSKFLYLFMIMFLFGSSNVFAKAPDDFEEGVYVIGTHVFELGQAVTAQEIMLGARSIPGNNLKLQDMVIYYKPIDGEGAWRKVSLPGKPTVPKAELPDNFAVEFINTVPLVGEELEDELELAKPIALAELAEELAKYVEANYSSENWANLNTIKTNGDAAINAA